MMTVLQDARAALRLIRRQPAFSVFVVLTLAVGIGAATAVFALVHAVLLRDLPFADPDRLVWMYNLRTERDRAPLSIPDLNDYKREASSVDGLQFSLDREPTADLYVPLLQMPPTQAALLVARMNWVVRTRDDPRQLESAVRSAVRSVDPEVATSSMRTLDALLQTSLNPRRLNVRLLEYFGEVAVALSAMGVYAIAAFSVGARRRELAIRSAFGAGRHKLARLVFVEELRPVLVGLLMGLTAALALSRFFGSLVFGISPTDPTTYVGVAVVLLAVSTVAVYVPARRAGLVDPVELMRD